jgi:hypothetical protein
MSKYITSLFLFFSLAVVSVTNAQVEQSWLKLYDGTIGFESVYPAGGHALAIDKYENVYVTESSFYNTNGVMVWATVKYNSAGVQQWAANYNEGIISNKWAVPQSIAADDSGNVYVTGQCNNDQATFYHCVTVKYNSAGVQQWVRSFGNADTSQGIKITLDGSGNVYVAGNFVHGSARHTLGTIKYNSSGVQQWISYYNGYDFIASSISVDNSGNVYTFGNGYSQPNYGGACFYETVKYNSSSVQQWAQQYTTGFGGGAIARCMVIDNSGNVYVTGAGISDQVTYWDYTTIKYNSGGVQQWLKKYDNPSHGTDDAFSVAVDNSGNVNVAGFNSETAGYRITTVQYNSSGVQQWVQECNGGPSRWENNLYGPLVRVDSALNVYVTGNVCNNGDNSYYTFKYNSSGTQQWLITYREPTADSSHYVKDMAVSPGGDVFVTGNQKGTGTYWDCVTIKYNQPVGLKHNGNEIPSRFNLSQNYPNPFNPSTKIKFEIPQPPNGMKTVHVKLEVYDIIGRKVAILLEEDITPGKYEIEWDASIYSSGIYMYKLTAGEFTDVKKMILVK